jgi:hypothetical protein
MPTNTRMESCLAEERGAMVFWSPDVQQRKPGSKVQIIDVFSLQVVTGYTRDPQGRLLLESQPSVAAGRNWSLAKAAQLMRNDARPHRWVALQLNKQAWLTVLGKTIAGFLTALERQDRKLELLLERTAPSPLMR